MSSGTTGWRSNVGISSSISLYEGVRARTDTGRGSTSGISIYPNDPVDTNTIDKIRYVSGSYPSTGSLQVVKVHRPAAASSQNITATEWYEEHFNPILGLYDYYSGISTEFATGVYDYYSFYFDETAPGTGTVFYANGGIPTTVTSSFTYMAWIKPVVGGSGTIGTRDFGIMGGGSSKTNERYLSLTGSTGALVFKDRTLSTTLTSSVAIPRGVWSHVAFSADLTAGSGTFYVNGVSAGRVPYAPVAPVSGIIIIGGETDSNDNLVNTFGGFVFEARVYGRALGVTELSGTYLSTCVNSASVSQLVSYFRFNDGPQGTAHGFTQGSGAFNYGSSAAHALLLNGEVGSHLAWQPNDNMSFTTLKTRLDVQSDMFRVIHVPSMFYGRQIATGSVNVTCTAYSAKGVVRTIVDDGRGSLYLSGSITRPVSGEDVAGVRWRRVGNVFYNEGLIVVTDPSLLDIGTNYNSSNPNDLLQVSFSGLEKISTKVFNCRLGPSDANASNNPTFSRVDSQTGKRVYVREDGVTYITAVGIYDEERRLVGVAKLAQPIRKREKHPLTIRLRFDF